MKTLFALLFLLAVFLKPVLADEYSSNSGTAGLPLEYLLSFTANARAAGLGNAYTGFSGDPSCAYWNPAGIANTRCNELSFVTIPLFAGTQYAGVDFACAFDDFNTIGISILKLDSGSAERTNSYGGGLGYTFAEKQSSFILSYGRALSETVSAGLNYKTFYQTIDAYSRQGYNMDLGFIFQKSPDTGYGLVLQNILPLNFGPDAIGQNIKTGIFSKLSENKLIFAADIYLIDIFSSRQFRWGTGLEYSPIENLFFRLGVNQQGISYGFGVGAKNFNFDYALSSHQLDFTHKFSVNLRYGFTPTEEERTAKARYDKILSEKKLIEEDLALEQSRISGRRQELKIETWAASKLLEAKGLIELKKYLEAEIMLKDILLKKPECVEADVMLKELRRKTGTDSLAGRYMEAHQQYQQKDYALAVEETEKILNIDPAHKGAKTLNFLARAQLYIKDRKYNDAKGELFELLRIDPQHQEGTMLLKRVQTILDVLGTSAE